MWSIHCMIQTSPQRRAWPDSNQLQPLCLQWVLKPAPGNFGIKLFRHATACLKHLKPGHLAIGTRCLQSHAPGLLALRRRCHAAANGSTPCWFATPKPKPGQHAWQQEPLPPNHLLQELQSWKSPECELDLLVCTVRAVFTMCSRRNPQHPLKPSNEVDIQKIIQKKDHSIFLEILNDNLHQFTCFGDITSL